MPISLVIGEEPTPSTPGMPLKIIKESETKSIS